MKNKPTKTNNMKKKNVKQKRSTTVIPKEFKSGSAEMDKSIKEVSALWKTNEDGSKTISLADVMQHLNSKTNQ
jgi:hypothetical protein